MTKASHILIMGKGTRYVLFVWICASAIVTGMGAILSFFSKGEDLLCLSSSCQTPTLLAPGVFNADVPSFPTQGWMLPGTSAESRKLTAASPWSGGTARRPSTATELSTHPSLEGTTQRSKSRGANKPQPRPHSQVSSTPQTQPAPGHGPRWQPSSERTRSQQFLSPGCQSVWRAFRTLKNHSLQGRGRIFMIL